MNADAASDEIRAQLQRHHQAAFGWALTCCGWERDLADEVLQSTYLKVLEGQARYEGRSSFKTWLFGVIRYTAWEHRRRRFAKRFLPLRSVNGQPDTTYPGEFTERLVRAETAQRLLMALGSLPRRQRELLHLVFYQELTVGEAARVLGISVGTARTHYQRGKARLRQLLTREDRDGAPG